MKEIVVRSKKHGDRVAIVDEDDFNSLSKYKWFLHSSGYAVRNLNNKVEYMHRVIISPGKLCVDHIDHNKLNNRKDNLRVATRAQNSANMRPRRIGSSVYKGVCWVSSRGKWAAYIKSKTMHKNIGYFADEIEAAKAYDRAASQYHGEFATLNFT